MKKLTFIMLTCVILVLSFAFVSADSASVSKKTAYAETTRLFFPINRINNETIQKSLYCEIWGNLTRYWCENREYANKPITTPLPLPPPEPTVPYLRIDWFFNPSPNNPDKRWYHTAGSLGGIKRYAQVFTGKVPSLEELEGLCLYEIWLPQVESNGANWTQLGFGKKIERNCRTPAGSSIVNDCSVSRPPTGVHGAAKFNKTLEHVTLTDNDTYAVYVQTWEDGLRDWNVVVPINKRVSDENKAAILKHVREDLGFLDELDIYYVNYASCFNVD